MIEQQILIVDNNKDFLRLCEHNFTELVPNSQVFTASNGVEALHQLDTHPCDLIIADCDLPQMNGLDFARAVHQLLPAAHILLMSAQDAAKIETMARRRHLSIDGCLDKTAFLKELWECDSRKLCD
jgi:CheY-like chemotaxis protein